MSHIKENLLLNYRILQRVKWIVTLKFGRVKEVICIQYKGQANGLNLIYLLMLHDTQYRTCERLQ
jgi:hypothetical protein